jgi:hypothetical protein
MRDRRGLWKRFGKRYPVITFDDVVRIICLSCKKWVAVGMIEYGNGHIAACTVCRKLAYNGK